MGRSISIVSHSKRNIAARRFDAESSSSKSTDFSISSFLTKKKQPKYAFLPARISRSFIICSDVNRNTSEVLLEVYDRVNKSQRFLGLGIVGIDELLANPSQRQIIPLQNRPYEEEDITGTLTVEVSKRATRGVI